MGREQIEQMKEKIEALKSEMIDQARTLFYEEVKVIFANYPELQSFGWTQYTPYFNDGDTCSFSCHGSSDISMNQYGPNPEEDDGFEADEALEYVSVYKSQGVDPNAPWSERAAHDITSLISLLGDEVMEDLFGDHSEVIVGREKIVVEAYEHD